YFDLYFPLQTVKTDMVKHDVEVESSGECVDEIDKLTEVSMKLISIGSMQVFDQFNISNKFAPFIRKSVYKLGVNLKLLQWHLVDVHIIE
ncbi:hypothetical protein Tco_0354026, partial [Tanacetum coccineum]